MSGALPHCPYGVAAVLSAWETKQQTCSMRTSLWGIAPRRMCACVCRVFIYLVHTMGGKARILLCLAIAW
jgi:hypothetical protein